jgi:diphthamide biosynthesis protein 4
MPDATSHTKPTYYKILGLSYTPHGALSRQDVKAAYHQTLLRYHPDKANASLSNERRLPRPHEEIYTIDQIVEAYAVLASPSTRAAYDRELGLSATGASSRFTNEALHTGVEVYDLEDLAYDEHTTTWSRGCRCGYPHGYVLTEAELEKESSQSEIYVACKGCSLWIKVLFGMMASDREMEETEALHRKPQHNDNGSSV